MPIICASIGALAIFIVLTILEDMFLAQGMGTSPFPPILGSLLVFISVLISLITSFRKQTAKAKKD